MAVREPGTGPRPQYGAGEQGLRRGIDELREVRAAVEAQLGQAAIDAMERLRKDVVGTPNGQWYSLTKEAYAAHQGELTDFTASPSGPQAEILHEDGRMVYGLGQRYNGSLRFPIMSERFIFPDEGPDRSEIIENRVVSFADRIDDEVRITRVQDSGNLRVGVYEVTTTPQSPERSGVSSRGEERAWQVLPTSATADEIYDAIKVVQEKAHAEIKPTNDRAIPADRI